MNVHVLKVPYDCGHRCERMARGPGYLLSNKVLEGAIVESLETDLLGEAQSAFALARQLSVRVQAIHRAGDFPVVLAGNCNCALGVIAGLDASHTGVLWFDAHGEFNTPETTVSGFFDGMPLAVATGRCWRRMAESIPGFMPVPSRNIVLVGVRQTDPDEQAALDAAGIAQIRAQASDLALLPGILDRVAAHIHHWYIHLDLDVLDPSEATANEWVPPGGLRAAEIAGAIEYAAKLRPIGAIALASLDPACDQDGRALEIARTLLRLAAGRSLR